MLLIGIHAVLCKHFATVASANPKVRSGPANPALGSFTTNNYKKLRASSCVTEASLGSVNRHRLNVCLLRLISKKGIALGQTACLKKFDDKSEYHNS